MNLERTIMNLERTMMNLELTMMNLERTIINLERTIINLERTIMTFWQEDKSQPITRSFYWYFFGGGKSWTTYPIIPVGRRQYWWGTGGVRGLLTVTRRSPESTNQQDCVHYCFQHYCLLLLFIMTYYPQCRLSYSMKTITSTILNWPSCSTSYKR